MIAYQGPLWRILFASVADPLAPVSSREGRFHHSGQKALYASLTSEGASVAIKRYVGCDDPPRYLWEFHASLTELTDLRALSDPSRAAVIWQDNRSRGEPAPTWQYSDAARAQGAKGVIYRSRSRPELSHLCLFVWDAQQFQIKNTSAI